MSAEQCEPQGRTGAHIAAAALKRHGVEVIFGQSIPAALFLVKPQYGIRQVGYRAENAGSYMADAYARLSHKVGVVTAQNGPAATLLVAGLAECYKASIPVVAIVQDVHRKMVDKNAFQELDHAELFKGVAKWTRRVSEIDRLEDYIDMAFTAAASGRAGPAVLVIPIDLFNESAGQSGRQHRCSLGHFPLDRCIASPETIAQAASLLARARAPLVIAGGGVHLSDASAALARLQEGASLPVATTAMGKGAVDETHPLSVGVVGYFMGERGRTRHLRQLVSDADVILMIGNRTNQNGTDSWTLYPHNARYIHLDIDGQEVGRNYDALRLVGDARLTLEALNDALQQQDLTLRHQQRADLSQRIAAGHERWQAEVSHTLNLDASPLRPERLMRDLDTLLTPETIVVADASYSSVWVANYLTARGVGSRFVTPRGLAGLGWGFPYALGAKIACPQAPVFALVGDGGFAHVWSELETARRMGINVVLVVLNNQILGYEKHAEKALFGDYSDACDFHAVDHAAVARACGCSGVRIDKAADFLPALKAAFSAGVTTVIDVITDERAYPPVTLFDDKDGLKY
ncbi:acetolactate synthase catalytic subunit [Erwinia sp. OLTSP20]|uniref:acetolactate synthase catalytic subunit n=1 Tax=unclassified Erwinia TaxID=2622719 RepID=UPI000C19ACB4|nr:MULTISPECIES: acetolactate synthase catalytic subunit [unclassified Erwinia]PIJ50155.1 acetolactate synthase catalytic subunit [Erwinia sp. OAMSP11]PIJ71921.1 acetolactate synthase catalytic subunit [Erwinia sp. OLSSP12]PIJ81123.1 acetolactate synthase catalytic subunit [Erwinia sp. OLCASP19]PIJ83553.1 acetolactate synthase catalytic subunit [Erwinia sp. OLMTSP26]PIJ86168.1 acetolactate synthase catalytic subunit [Erwinia sp. OLMDSP33]